LRADHAQNTRLGLEPPGRARYLCRAMRLVTVGDGAGPARAFVVPGNDLCAEFYRPLAERLAVAGVATTLATLPGWHGVPPLPAPGWDALADAVTAALPGPDATLVGHSLGGLLALLVAARRPAALGRLVLVEPAVFPGRLVARAAARRYRDTVVHGDAGRFVNWNGGLRRVHDEAAFPRAMIELYLEVRRTSDRATAARLMDTLPDLYPLPFARVAVPVLVVRGASSGWRARAMLAPLARRLGAERVVIPGAAHWIANEQDEALAAAVARFACTMRA
jgi:pimeloyl-ACP methyl ester carboxylesterase